MPSSFTDLETFWECPRKLGFRKLGYSPASQNEAITTGSFVHEGLRAFFAGGAFDINYAHLAIDKAKDKAILRVDKVADRERHQKLISQAVEASNRAYMLLSRYFTAYTGDYKGAIPEVEIGHLEVVCHVDLIAEFEGELVIVDFKTSKSPDLRWYDFSGQCDLYAYVLWNCPEDTNRIPFDKKANPVSLIIYDIIANEGLFRHTRPPNLERGKRLFGQVSTLDNYEVSSLLGKPQYQWTCPRCQYFTPCYIAETGDMKQGIEYLIANYVKESRKDK